MPDASSGTHRQHLAAVVFADIAGYSGLSARDHEAALRQVGAFQAASRDAAEAHDGRLVKFLGDGALLEFRSSAAAMKAARALAAGFAESVPGSPASSPRLRIGVHVGEVAAAEDGDLYGDGVNVAARLQQVAEPGSIWVSEDVWRQLRAHREFRFASCGERDLKGQRDRWACIASRPRPWRHRRLRPARQRLRVGSSSRWLSSRSST